MSLLLLRLLIVVSEVAVLLLSDVILLQSHFDLFFIEVKVKL